jgi:hypothetical protein
MRLRGVMLCSWAGCMGAETDSATAHSPEPRGVVSTSTIACSEMFRRRILFERRKLYSRQSIYLFNSVALYFSITTSP